MKPREYCCCAIPILNFGIYFTLLEHFGLGILVALLSLATPSIVGAATPSIAPVLLAIICFIASGVQVLGFLGVLREKPILFRRYVTLHTLLTSAAFSIAATWIAISASRHSAAKTKCINDFFPPSGAATVAAQGDTLCNIFPWVDVGIMAGLWVLLAVLHIYTYVIISSYGAAQRRDHASYDRLGDPKLPITKDSIPMDNRHDEWDSRPSNDYGYVPQGDSRYNHVPRDSVTSVSEVLGQPQIEPRDGLRATNYEYSSHNYPPQDYSSQSHHDSRIEDDTARPYGSNAYGR